MTGRFITYAAVFVHCSFSGISGEIVKSTKIAGESVNQKYRVTVVNCSEATHPNCVKFIVLHNDTNEVVTERSLVNDRSPRSIFVCDSGDVVVSLGDVSRVSSPCECVCYINGKLAWMKPTKWFLRESTSVDWSDKINNPLVYKQLELVFWERSNSKAVSLQFYDNSIVTLDVGTGRVLRNLTKSDLEALRQKSQLHSLKLLKSENDWDRAMGAILAKNLSKSVAIPLLVPLLDDKSCYTIIGDESDSHAVYFVQDAARITLASFSELDENGTEK